MNKRLVVLASIVASALVAVGGPLAHSSETPACTGGTQGAARLASDPAGDMSYAGQAVPNANDNQEDIRFVDATVSAGTATFVMGVEDLADADPPGGVGLLVNLTVSTDAGDVAVSASRSFAEGNAGSGSINGKDAAAGVTATFDSTSNVITVSGPASVLPAHASSLGLGSDAAETRADGGAVLAPRTDTASGDCKYSFGTPAETAAFDPTKATITVIDTGSEASNPEFNYDPAVPGPNGQFVGWWDFSGTTSHPACGAATTIWCTTHGPYDPDLASGSHGTGTTGMAAGTNNSVVKTKSACPGCNLAVAKVLNEDPDATGGDSGLDGDMAAAIRWAVDVVHTDVISVSIGAVAPIPEAALHDTYMAQRYAREHGVLLTFANGNGWGDAEGPGQPGAFMNYGNSVDVLSVGANGIDGYLVTTDPEVTGPFTVMTSSSQAADTDGTPDGYHSISGTSFSTPFTAGLAAHLISSGRLCGAADLSPAFIEQLIKDTAVDDPTIPPSNEGYGEVSLSTMDTALGVLCNGDTRPTVDPVTKTYVDSVSGTERQVSSDETVGNALFGSGTTGGPTIVRSPQNSGTAGVIGLSTPTLADTETYELTLLPGQSIDDVFGYVGDTSTQPDFDVYLYDVTAGVNYDGATFLKSAATGAGLAEHLTYTNDGLVAKKVRVIVAGFTIIQDQAFSVTGTPLGAPVDQGLAAITVALI